VVSLDKSCNSIWDRQRDAQSSSIALWVMAKRVS
jgi:hypothetical protein